MTSLRQLTRGFSPKIFFSPWTYISNETFTFTLGSEVIT